MKRGAALKRAEPKRRKWSIAIEADEEMDEDDIRLTLETMPGIDVVNIELIETSYTEEQDDDD